MVIIALVLGILIVWTGFFGFVYRPAADDPNAIPLGTEANQAALSETPTTAPIQTESFTTMTEGEQNSSADMPEEWTVPAMTASEETQDPSAAMQDEPGFSADTAEDGLDSQADATGDTPAPTEITSEGVPAPSDAVTWDIPATSETTPDGMPDPTVDMTEEMSEPTVDTTKGWTNPPTVMPEQKENNEPGDEHKSGFRLFMRILCFVFATAEAVDILLLVTLRKNIRQHRKKDSIDSYRPTKVDSIPVTMKDVEQPIHPILGISLGKVHDVGKREYQQDSFGQIAVLYDTGILAVLADGMGGLSNGERVSQRIVMEALNYGVTIQTDQLSNTLPDMVKNINRAVNQMLGPDGLYTSGSTVVSALIVKNALWWISVGDSRIYLYRDQQLNQLSRDHDLMQDWMGEILEGKRTMAEAMNDPDGRKLTSFIGMGELRYIDHNHSPIPLRTGDRVLLMSDGIYGSVSDAEMETILRSSTNVQEAASRIAKKITDASLSYQDNYTLVILGYDLPNEPTNNI